MMSFKHLSISSLLAIAAMTALTSNASAAYCGRDAGIDCEATSPQLFAEMRVAELHAAMAKLPADKMAKAMAMEDKLMQMEMERESSKMKMDMDIAKARRELEIYVRANRINP